MATVGARIDFDNVSTVFDDGADRILACRNVSFSIEPGQSIALIGPSGCGKSTTLRMASGLLAPTEGSVRVNGEPVSRPCKTTAFIPQDLGLFPWKTVLQNAAIGLTVRRTPKAEALRSARAALQQVNLSEFERAYPKELSGGMRQRLALARALATDADLLLMDEPLSAIDALLRESLQDTLLDLWRKRSHTQVFVTHSIEEAVFLGQRIIVFSERPGTVIADIANPDMGTESWRDSDGFSQRCREVRTILGNAYQSDDALCELRESISDEEETAQGKGASVGDVDGTRSLARPSSEQMEADDADVPAVYLEEAAIEESAR